MNDCVNKDHLAHTYFAVDCVRVVMDANGKASKSGEISMSESKKTTPVDSGAEDVVVFISGEDSKAKHSVDSGQKLSASTAPMNCPSPEIRFSPSPNKPPKIPTGQTITRRTSMARSVFLKPKSRFGEQSVPIDSNLVEEISSVMQERAASNQASPLNKIAHTSSTLKESMTTTSSVSPKTPLMGGEDEAEQIYKKVSSHRKLKHRRVRVKVLIEWIVLLCMSGNLAASLTIHKLQHFRIWGLELWKWCLLVLVMFSGLLVTKWSVNFVIYLIERNFLFRKNVLYFVHGLRKSVRVCIWLGLVLLTWVL